MCLGLTYCGAVHVLTSLAFLLQVALRSILDFFNAFQNLGPKEMCMHIYIHTYTDIYDSSLEVPFLGVT